MRLYNEKKIGLVLVLITSFCYGTMPAVAQRALQSGLSVETILAFRFVVAIILIWMYVLFQKLPFKLPLKNIGYLLFLGVLTIGTSTFMYESYKYIPGAIASLLVMLYVVLVVIIEIVIGRDKPHLSKLGPVLLASIGLIAVVWTPEGNTSLNPLGIIFACMAGLCYALYAIGLGGIGTRATKPEIVTAYSLLPVGLFSVIRCIANQQPIIPDNFDQWGYALYLAVLSTFIAGICFVKAVKYIGSGNAALINTTEPLIAYVAGIILMSDAISLKATFGGILIIVAIVWLNLADKKEKK